MDYSRRERRHEFLPYHCSVPSQGQTFIRLTALQDKALDRQKEQDIIKLNGAKCLIRGQGPEWPQEMLLSVAVDEDLQGRSWEAADQLQRRQSQMLVLSTM